MSAGIINHQANTPEQLQAGNLRGFTEFAEIYQ